MILQHRNPITTMNKSISYHHLKGNCHELHMHLSKVVCGNMPGFLPTFRSQNRLFCLYWSLSPAKTCHKRAVLPCIDAALNQTWNVQAVFFKLNCSWEFPFNSYVFRGKHYPWINKTMNQSDYPSPSRNLVYLLKLHSFTF